MKALKRIVGLDMNRRLCVERSDCEWVQIEHAVYRSLTSVCAAAVVLKLKQAVDMVDRVMAVEDMAHVYAKIMTRTTAAMMTKMDANRYCF